ncbi:hypothetical protein NP493_556g02061 [Ridgeia piscesae]|uniref:Uncharacterized protein n=1 Tax=Ridgeia piscesae TaxID=27915 RepID=A0AAD9KVI5_RIDPI|nr:hypothetical protein NP493_556g02061 [Ridgeia piscesae]
MVFEAFQSPFNARRDSVNENGDPPSVTRCTLGALCVLRECSSRARHYNEPFGIHRSYKSAHATPRLALAVRRTEANVENFHSHSSREITTKSRFCRRVSARNHAGSTYVYSEHHGYRKENVLRSDYVVNSTALVLVCKCREPLCLLTLNGRRGLEPLVSRQAAVRPRHKRSS